MASGTLPPPVAPPRSSRGAAKVARPSEFIDEQIGKTRAYVKSVDVARGVLLLLTGLVAYLLAMALVDHWLIPGGLGVLGRSLAFVLLVGGAAWHLARQLAPLFLCRINPLYAAHTIEQCRPSFKNSLLSVLQLRDQRDAVPDAVYESVENHAASRLAEVPVESTVDRGPLIRIGYVMLGVVIAASLYYLVSPKDALQSAGRVLLPWSDIAAPTRVSIADVRPGDETAIRGQQVEVSAEITGLNDDEIARLVFSTEDGQVVDREVPMRLPEGSHRHIVMLPPGDERLQGSVTYRVEAGDARSENFRITVEPTPMIEVVAIEYDYPAYTAPILEDRRALGTGDIRAVEGTRVTIRCRANQAIARAVVDFDADGKHTEPMTVRGEQAAASFVVSFADRANLVPQFTGYQIKFYNRKGRDNPTPVQHAIEVLPDLPPEVSLERPAEPVIEVPEDETVEFRATARDADFKLSEVLFRHEGRAGERQAAALPLLAPEKAPWQGKYDAQWRKTPRELGYRAGDVIHYWIEAVDNKTPIDTANRAATRPATIRVLAPLRPMDKPKPNDHQQNDPKEHQNRDQDPKNDGQKNDGQNGENADGQNDRAPNEQEPNKDEHDKDEQNKDEQNKGEQNKGEKDGNGAKDQPQEKNGDMKGGEKDGPPNEAQKNDGDPNAAEKPDQKPDQKPGDRDGQPRGADEKANGADNPSEKQPERKGPADDAEAVRELLKDREQCENGGNASGNTGSKDGAGTNDSTADKAPSSDPNGAKPDGDGEEKPRDEKDEKSDEPQGAGGPQKDDQPQGGNPPNDKGKTGGGMGDESKDAQPKPNGDSGGDAKPKGSEQDKPADKKNDSTPGAGKGRPSPAGPGKPSKDDKGSPEHQGTNKPQPDVEKQPDNAKPSKNEAESPSIDEKQSRNPTKGEKGGDRSQGGESGGGGNSPNAGNDTPGTNTEADEGANAAKTPGKGETGDSAGSDVEADGQTGQSKDKRGKGSDGTPKDKTDKPQDRDGNAGDGKSPPNANANAKPSDEKRDGAPGDNPGKGTLNPGGGRPEGDSQDTPADAQPGPDVEDPADLDYAKKATDLALDHLRDRMKQGNEQELLDKLGWTREDAERFLANWEKIKGAAATQQSNAAEKRLHEELKSLGLRRGSTQFREGQATKDTQRGLDTGVSVPTPSEFLERQRAYRVGTGRNGPRDGGKD